jgi:Tol biopolymer transport system component
LLILISFQLAHPQRKEIGSGSYPVFSPTGDTIAFESDRCIHIMNINDNRSRQITTLSWDFRPCWSPNGLAIAFQSYGRTQKNIFAIWIINSDGSNQHQFVDPANAGDQTPKWSRDGKFIAWTHGNQLWVADGNGRNARPLTQEAAKEWEYICDWSPDMKTVAYLRCDKYDSQLPYKIWLIDADGNNQRILGEGLRALDAKWSADGKHLYYSTGINVFRVRIDSPEKAYHIYSFGFDYHISHFDLSKDEQFILFSTAGPGIDDEKIILDKIIGIKK